MIRARNGLGTFFPADVRARLNAPDQTLPVPGGDATDYASQLRQEADLHEQNKGSRAVLKDYPDLKPPWIDPPGNHQPFVAPGVIALPAAPNSAETVILSFPVPQGWDGVIKYLSATTNVGGFQDGSGLLIWRLRLNKNQYVKNFDNIQVRLGQAPAPFPGDVDDLLIYSGELYEITIVNVNEAGGGSQAMGMLRGYLWPKQ